MQQFVTHYGYLAVFLLMLAESACVPIPSELIMLCGGALAGGAAPGAQLGLVGVIVAGVVGTVAGSYVAWGVGRYAGQAAWRRWGRHVLLTEWDIDRAQRWFDRHGNVSVLIGRVVPVVRTFISLPAGVAAMPPARFGVYTTLGCIPWTAALGIVGFAVGARWQQVADGFHGPTYIIGGMVAVLIVIGVVAFIRKRRKEWATYQARLADRNPDRAL